MKLIVGLGNPGEKYEKNRHNAGFMFIDYFKSQDPNSKELNFVEKGSAALLKTKFADEQFLLVKPQTYMNNSGLPVKQLFIQYKLKLDDLIVAHDDLDIPLGKFKIDLGVGPKLHNGIESIEENLGSKKYLRIRLGVDNRSKDNWTNGESYVLQDFSPEEEKIINQTFQKILDRLKSDFFFKSDRV